MGVAVGMAMQWSAGQMSLPGSGSRSQGDAADRADAGRLPRGVAVLFILGVSLLCWGMIGMAVRALLS